MQPSLVGSNVTLARQCVSCVQRASNPWDCQYCMQVSASQPDPDASRASCLDCLTSTSLGSWACGECAKMTTEPQRTECIHPPPPPSSSNSSSSSSPTNSNATSCDTTQWACQECDKPYITAPAACRTCVSAMRAKGLDGAKCLACGSGGVSDAGLQEVCMAECVPATAAAGTDWSCSQYCEAAPLVGTNVSRSRECGACVAAVSNPWDCQNCIQVTATLADADAARATCFHCLTSSALGAYTCGTCASKATPAERLDCITAASTATVGRRRQQREQEQQQERQCSQPL
ncbi:hypothetical protein PLESTB_001145100 [Pleodorina starrii]|uniref:Uncharacterized protein n=1 Tax=Pleodorina starrii TaxID=330485 RepID=A0A9W6BS86_9CHLO|nr:hypothetical protein PLESTB_001145100 [Pleodorina starrii]GLC66934.1 hypothetical protein PLESTF_000492000 [Pleodorina starrii]